MSSLVQFQLDYPLPSNAGEELFAKDPMDRAHLGPGARAEHCLRQGLSPCPISVWGPLSLREFWAIPRAFWCAWGHENIVRYALLNCNIIKRVKVHFIEHWHTSQNFMLCLGLCAWRGAHQGFRSVFSHHSPSLLLPHSYLSVGLGSSHLPNSNI